MPEWYDTDMTETPAQTAKRRITICCYCRKRIMRVRNGEWYHIRYSSTSCNPEAGNRNRATPLEIEVDR